MARRLALFDLDNTLLAGDSDHAWGEFLITRKLVDAASHRARNDEFYQNYLDGDLDIHAHVKFTLLPILNYSREQRDRLHREFMREFITPMILRNARTLVANHKRLDDFCVIITATNAFITGPIAAVFKVDSLLATEIEMEDDLLTGNIAGIPCYRSGKVTRLEQWLQDRGDGLSLEHSIFYSDSVNDVALLERVTEAVAVDPDQQLSQIAHQRGWKTISLREQAV